MASSTAVLRDTYCMTQKDISDYFGIPLSTVKNWDARGCMPDYVMRMMWAILDIRRDCKLLADLEIDCASKDSLQREDDLEHFIAHNAMRNLGYELYAIDDLTYKYDDKGHIDG